MKRVRTLSPSEGRRVIFRDSKTGTFMSGVTSSVSAAYAISRPAPVESKKKEAQIEKAVYGHIQAVRALGRQEINTVEIAEALSIPVREVNRILEKLTKRGVKLL